MHEQKVQCQQSTSGFTLFSGRKKEALSRGPSGAPPPPPAPMRRMLGAPRRNDVMEDECEADDGCVARGGRQEGKSSGGEGHVHIVKRQMVGAFPTWMLRFLGGNRR
jgi:hypothetical protein